jgi:acyl-CoA synthetase (AMP-forming)/AMP-acid ligase II
MSFVPVIAQVLAQCVVRPGHLALVESGRSIPYAELEGRIDRVAASLQRDGVQPGESVALCAASTLDGVVAMLGVLRCGAVAVPLPVSATAPVLAGLLADCGAKLVFVDAATASALGALEIPQVTLDDSPTAQPLSAWLAQPGSSPGPVEHAPDAPFNIIYSSGTTGAPKGIVHPQGLRSAQVARSARLGYGADSVTLLATPLYSNITLTGLYPTLALGGTVILMPKFDAAEYLQLAQRWRATQTVLVSVQYQRILAQPGFDACDLSAFQLKIAVGAPSSASLKAELLRRWPGGLVDLYGLTEGGGTCMLLAHEHPDKLHTVGRPAPGHELRVIDDAGNELPAGQVGEVVGHSPIMMIGYHRLPEATSAAEWHDAAGRRFIRTGDLGRFDTDGFLTLVDRKKDMIISGGFNLYPSDLEAVLAKHADVAEAAVVGVPSARWGETPVAFVVLRAGALCDAAALMGWVNQRVGKTQRIAAVEWVDALPRGPVGKVLKRELRAAYRGDAL